ncbi:MAG: GNAT family N-acetyltransferase, partial [Ilumatobacteraceae bacterium]|nr:GNAT family N-acetyltransferase [Ilumatobacteraceae bacterium]
MVVRRYASTNATQLQQAIIESVQHLAPWMPWAALEPLKLSDREELIAKWAEQWDRGEAFMFGVFRDEVLVGGCGLNKRVGAHGLD